jgi:hypothetical protein
MPALAETAAAAANKKGSVEETYQKLTQHQVIPVDSLPIALPSALRRRMRAVSAFALGSML